MTKDEELIILINELEKELSSNSANLIDWKSALHYVDIFFEEVSSNKLDIKSDYRSAGAIFRIFYNQLDDVIKDIEKQEEKCLTVLKDKVI
ncbi:hypothetical protein HB847_13510 [Listeria booriae]|uniref:Uncharacterized protein n=1 Tax=Listeria booriae TaxID=1552123 RepID=A0A841Y900_9LIST|nr:hypothetical protein [Listeria booriae]MBC1373391.1 hypothetical protein [Listeria booriae]